MAMNKDKAIEFINKLMEEDPAYDIETYPLVKKLIEENPVAFREYPQEMFSNQDDGFFTSQ